MTALRAGMKVACVLELGDNEGEIFPVVGQVYTVRAIERNDEGAYLLLREIINKPAEYEDGGYGEPGFCSTAFRPVAERKTDISVFKALLAPVNTKQKERV